MSPEPEHHHGPDQSTAQETSATRSLARLSEVGLQVFNPTGVKDHQEGWIISGAEEIEPAYEVIDGKEMLIGWSPIKGPTFGIHLSDGLYYPHIDDMSVPEDKWIVPEAPLISLEDAAEFICQNFNKSN